MRCLSHCRLTCIIAVIAIGLVAGVWWAFFRDKTIEMFWPGRLHLGPSAHGDYVNEVAFSPNGKLLASASHDTTVRIWDVTTGQLKYALRGHSSIVWSLTFSPDGNTLASGDEDRVVILWDVATGRRIARLPEASNSEIVGLAYSLDGRLLACSGGCPSGFGTVRDAKTLLLKYTLAESNCVTCLVFSPDSSSIVGGDVAGIVGIWNASTGKRIAFFPVAPYSASIRSVEFTPDGVTLMTCSREFVKLWSFGSQKLKSVIVPRQRHEFSRASMSPDSRYIAVGGNLDELPGPGPGEFSVWDMASGKELAVVDGFRGPVTAVAFSPDNGLIAVGEYHGGVSVWKISDILEATKNPEQSQ